MTFTKNELRLAMNKVNRIHFVGIGGVGMSPIAELFYDYGFEVAGSDLKESITTKALANIGIKIYIGHSAENILGADVLVVSSAIAKDNPEVLAATKSGVTIIQRAEMLAELMRFKYGVAIAGTHGKTTTTSLVARILSVGGLDPTYVIGGELISSANNAKLGESRYVVAEADESDASFLHLYPILSVITNIDEDHMNTYNSSVEALHSTFVEFIHNLPFYGKAIVCIEDPNIKSILPKIHRQVVKYGFSDDADFQAVDIKVQGLKTKFRLIRANKNDLDITLNMPGSHNVLNSLAAIAVATELEIDDTSIINSLKTFNGIGRRFQQYGNFMVNNKKVCLVDDYGHHPKELEATLKTVHQCYPDKRIMLVFQPHRYSRTKDLFFDFVKILSQVDCLILLPVYSAGENKIPGASSKSLAKAIISTGKTIPILLENLDEVISTCSRILENEDVILISGAGNISSVAPQMATTWDKIS